MSEAGFVLKWWEVEPSQGSAELTAENSVCLQRWNYTPTNTCTFDRCNLFYTLYIMHYMFACVYMYIKIWNHLLCIYTHMFIYISMYSLICILLTK